jgi:hypothetical protein
MHYWAKGPHAGMSGNCDRAMMPTFGTAICSCRRVTRRVCVAPSGRKWMAFTTSESAASRTTSSMRPNVPLTNSVAIS